ncbi:MAG TPA: ABC transporter permease [Gaiellaceae bacterium]|nr:ABC transporter permease [Gaiellaceae bacterium]
MSDTGSDARTSASGAVGARPHRSSFARLALRRIAAGAATLVVVSALVFVGTEMLPGDAASAVLGRTAQPEQLAEVRELMGLDRPAVERYLDWLGGVVTGDLGNSAAGYAAGVEEPVWDEIRGPLWNSVILAAIVVALMIPLALLLGVVAATSVGRTRDHAISLGSLAVVSLPEFIIGSLLIVVFFSWLDVLPPVSLVPPGTSPLARPDVLVLPTLTLLGATLAGSTRMVRAGMLETLGSDFVQMARLNGLPERRVVLRYGLRNALAPAVQVFAQNIQYLIGGIIVVEYLFNYPGIGKELVDAVAIRDVRAVQSIAIVIAAVYIAVNIVADVIVIALVPKLRSANA